MIEVVFLSPSNNLTKIRQTDGRTDGKTDRYTDRHTDRWTDRQREGGI